MNFQRSHTFTCGSFNDKSSVENPSISYLPKRISHMENEEQILLTGTFTVACQYKPFFIKSNQYFVLKRKNDKNDNETVCQLYWYETFQSMAHKECFDVQDIRIDDMESNEIVVEKKGNCYRLISDNNNPHPINIQLWKKTIVQEKEKRFTEIDLDAINDPQYENYKNIFCRKKSLEQSQNEMKEIISNNQRSFERLFEQNQQMMDRIKKIEKICQMEHDTIKIQQKKRCQICYIL